MENLEGAGSALLDTTPMTDVSYDELSRVLAQDDDELKADLPAALDGVESDLSTLLEDHPDTYETLTERVSTLDGIAAYAAEEPETVDRFLETLWGCMALITETVPEVQEEITEEFSVTWVATDSAVTFHMESDPDPGTVSGGPGRLDDPTLVFEGETDILFSMLNDPDFEPVAAFMDGEFELEGPVNTAMSFAQMMESVTTNVENLN